MAQLNARRSRLGYFVVGLGVGALLDGFVLHQLLQWHHRCPLGDPDNDNLRSRREHPC